MADYQIDFVLPGHADLQKRDGQNAGFITVREKGLLIGATLNNRFYFYIVYQGGFENILSYGLPFPKLYEEFYRVHSDNHHLLRHLRMSENNVLEMVSRRTRWGSVLSLYSQAFTDCLFFTNDELEDYACFIDRASAQSAQLDTMRPVYELAMEQKEAHYRCKPYTPLDFDAYTELIEVARGYKDQPGYVYVMQARDRDRPCYKIGKTTDPISRARTFNVELPYADELEFNLLIPTPSYSRTEKLLHWAFRKRGMALDGEWFSLDERAIEELKQIEARANNRLGKTS